MKSLVIALAAACCAATADAQSTLQQFSLPGAGPRVTALGDLDHDGTPDFAIGASGQGIAAFVFSGPYGYGLFDLPDLGSVGAPPIAPAGDVDGNGTDDIAVGFLAPIPNAATVFSGVDGSLLLSIPDPLPGTGSAFGHRVVGIGDVNQDGHADLVVTSPHESVVLPSGLLVPDSGRARAYSGADGALLFTVTPRFVGHQFGADASPLGDVNADGVPEFIVSSLREVDVIDGKTGATLRVHSGAASDQFGFAVCRVDDANFDGIPDVVVGAPAFGQPSFGRVSVFSGKNGQPLSDFAGGAGIGAGFGAALAPLPAGPSGLARVVVGAPGGFGPLQPVIGMAMICEIGGNQGMVAIGASIGDGTGGVVATVGDANGDGAADALVCALEDAGGSPHYVVRHVSAKTLGVVSDVVNVSVTTGGTQTLSVDGVAIVPATYQPVSETAAGRPYLILGSLAGTTPGFNVGSIQVPLNPDAYFQFTAQTLGGGLISSGFGLLDDQGKATATIQLPALESPALVGVVLHHAALVFDGPGLESGLRGASNAVPLRIDS